MRLLRIITWERRLQPASRTRSVLFTREPRRHHTRSVLFSLSCLILFSSPLAAQQLAAIDPELSKQLLESNRQPDQRTLDRLAAIVSKNPKDVSARCLLGVCYDKVGLPDLAQEQFLAAVHVAPDNPALWMQLIKEHLKSGHSDLAMHLIETAQDRFPTDPEVLYWSGNYYAAKDQTDRASYAYQLALKDKREIKGLRSALGEVLLGKGRYGDALSLANEEIKRHPQFWLAYKVKAFALISLDKPDQALPPLKVAFEHFPGHPQIALAYAKTCVSSALWNEALAPALTYLNETTRLTSFDPLAKQLVAQALSGMPASQVRVVLPQVSRAVSAAKSNASYHFAMGDILDHLNYRDLAMKQYAYGLKREPDYARALFRLGNDYEVYKHDYAMALSLFRVAHKLAPDDPEISAHFERLNGRSRSLYNDLALQLKDWLHPAPSAEND